MAEFILRSFKKCSFSSTEFGNDNSPGTITVTEGFRYSDYAITTSTDQFPQFQIPSGRFYPDYLEGEDNIINVEFLEQADGWFSEWETDGLDDETESEWMESGEDPEWLWENGWEETEGETWIEEGMFLLDKSGQAELGVYDEKGFTPAEGAETNQVTESLVRIQVLAGLIR